MSKLDLKPGVVTATALQELFALAEEWNEQHSRQMAAQTATLDADGALPD